VRIKDGVSLAYVNPAICVALQVAQGVFDLHGCALTLTSLYRPNAQTHSYHSSGRAFDARINNIHVAVAQQIEGALRIALGSNFDVVLEGPGTPNAHIHVEYDPADPQGKKEKV
jgi:hypothetical protein